MDPIYLMLIVLNIHTGAEISRKIETGPFDTPSACAITTVGQPSEIPNGETIAVHE